MKIGFSSLVCPGWDLETIVERASSMGFDGVELRGLRGELHLPLAPELARDSDGVKRLFAESGVALVALGASATLDSKSAKEVVRQKAAIIEFIELASKLACPFVRIHLGQVQRGDDQQIALSRIAGEIASLAPVAARCDVTLLVENGSDFPGSRALWFVVDAVDHPAVGCCWNQCHAMTIGERPTTSIPRLAHKIGIVHVGDAVFDEQGVLLEYKPIGEGDTEVARQIELLKGLVYDRYLLFDWPKLWDESLPEPETVLPEAARFLREHVAASQSILTAYKGDKRAPRMAPRGSVPSRG